MFQHWPQLREIFGQVHLAVMDRQPVQQGSHWWRCNCANINIGTGLSGWPEERFLICLVFGIFMCLTWGSMSWNRGLSAFCRWLSCWCVRNLRLRCHRHDSGYSVRWLGTSWGFSSWVCSWKVICYRFKWSLLQRQTKTKNTRAVSLDKLNVPNHSCVPEISEESQVKTHQDQLHDLL